MPACHPASSSPLATVSGTHGLRNERRSCSYAHIIMYAASGYEALPFDSFLPPWHHGHLLKHAETVYRWVYILSFTR